MVAISTARARNLQLLFRLKDLAGLFKQGRDHGLLWTGDPRRRGIDVPGARWAGKSDGFQPETAELGPLVGRVWPARHQGRFAPLLLLRQKPLLGLRPPTEDLVADGGYNATTCDANIPPE
ncbi:hypothetical protein CTRI78_v001858 [Colletotrichum trifolii]|uniref:Uncharacterized protein n=1 Tax=Colletotrichum trifolii TaxID=5466 RepID=A0A4R8RVJ0_COLTR|nr:hypothetical protein CTRI78_v001858 [Colletotrichum trifolii]